MAKDFSYYFAQLRKTEAHRTKEAEAEIRKLYKGLLKDTQQFIAEEYVKFAEDGKLTYEILRANTENARFLAEVEQKLNGISPEVSSAITRTVEDMYTIAYNGMVEAVQKSSTAEELRSALQGLQGVTAETIKAAIENPIAGLTLSDTLEKNRKNIIWNIKREIGVGLTTGDRYDTMARRIAKSLDGDYKKAVRIVRTEAGRVREAGHLESGKEINDALKDGTTNMRMVKKWVTMKDGRVRDTHSSMNGVTVAMDEEFELPSGVKTMAPKQSGVAAEDINCRCFVKYELVDGQKASQQQEEMTDADWDVVENYTGIYGSEINLYLNGKTKSISAHAEEVSGKLHNILDGQSLPEAGIYYKGCGTEILYGKGVPKTLSNSEKLVGKVLTDRGFMSTSKSKKSARMHFDLNSEPILLKIRVPKGAKGLAVNDKSVAPYEQETLFVDHSKMTVLGVKKTAIETIIEVELLK